MKCPSCQFENPEGSLFCGECGLSFDVICPNCGAKPPPNFKFCNTCGHDLREPTEAPTVDYSQPQSYTPKHLKDKILTTRSSIEGERKLVTVFFADVANYTAMSEKLDPEEVHQIMDGCFKILMDEIHKYEGTINQFTGDGVMALFGAPVAHEDHAQRACYSALSVQKAMEEYGEKIMKEKGLDFKMRIGLNSGSVIVGSIGDDLRMDYTAVGDTTNLAARMESAAKPGGILLSKNTHRIAQHYFEFNVLDKLEVKGKEEPQEVFELIAPSEVETRFDASVAKGLTRFVGRKNSMAALMEPYEKVQSGSGQVVGIVGEAGVGKTRLIMEFKNRLPTSAYKYLQGQCIHYGDSIIYLPILDIIKSYFEIEEGDKEFIIRKKIKEKAFGLDEKLEHTIPSFQELLSLKVDDEEYSKLDPQVKRERTFEAIRNLLIRESQDNVLILVVEDLHWIDRTSEEFLDYLIEWIANTKIMLVLLYRTEYHHQWGSKTYYSKIGVDQLGAESSVELVKVMLEDGEVVPELRELILSRSAGNPLFMEEFTQSLLENGSIEKKDDQYVLSRDVLDVEVPNTIQGIIAARMDLLEDNLKRTMQVASVIGREFAFRILQTIVEMKEDLKANLLNLQGLEFIYEKSLFPELEYIFKHALTQEVAYNSLLQKRRKEIHKRIGKAIEEFYAESLEEFYEVLAYHYERAEIPDKAIRYLTNAADRAKSIYANEQAIVFYRSAIDQVSKFLNEEVESTEDWCKTATHLHESLGDVLEWTGQHDKARDALENALAQAPKHDLIWQARLHWKTGKIMRIQNRHGDSMRAYNLAETILGVEPVGSDPEWWQEWVQIQFERMSVYYFRNQWRKISELYEQVRFKVEQFGTSAQRISFLLQLCQMNLSRDLTVVSEETLTRCRTAILLCQETGDQSNLAWARFMLGFCHLWREELGEAGEQLKAALTLAERNGDIVHQSRCLTYLTVLYRKWGNIEKARQYSLRSLEASRGAQLNEYIGMAKANLAWVTWRDGDLPEAKANGEAALRLWQELPVGQFWPFKWTALLPMIGVALAQELDTEAVEYARAMLEPSQQRLPEALNLALEKAIKTLEKGELKMGTHLNHAIELAQELGYL
jgi:class 3 adenylate cyclase/tetratricopeptide (TPR) repeat protein